MSIMEKLFGKTKSKKTSKKSETLSKKSTKSIKVIKLNADQSNGKLAMLLKVAIDCNEIKAYKNINAFIDKFGNNPYPTDMEFTFTITNDIKKLFKTWNTLHYKCNNMYLNKLKDEVLATPSCKVENL